MTLKQQSSSAALRDAVQEYKQPCRAVREAIHAVLTPELGEGYESQHTGPLDQLEDLGNQTIQILADKGIISANDLKYDVIPSGQTTGTIVFSEKQGAQVDHAEGYAFAASKSRFDPNPDPDRYVRLEYRLMK